MAPYELEAALNVQDVLTAPGPALEAGKWYQVAVTGELTAEKKWRMRLYVDGKQVHEGTTKHLAATLTIPPSAILGVELFYFHYCYYSDLIGRTLVFSRPLAADDLAGFRPSDLWKPVWPTTAATEASTVPCV
jgi:hypothetical protein